MSKQKTLSTGSSGISTTAKLLMILLTIPFAAILWGALTNPEVTTNVNDDKRVAEAIERGKKERLRIAALSPEERAAEEKIKQQQMAEAAKVTAQKAAEKKQMLVEKNKKKAAALAKMAIKKDKITNTTWYRDKSSPDSLGRNSFLIYFGQKNDSVWMRFDTQYVGEDWLFFKKVIVKADDKTLEFSTPNPERHVGYGHVTEWIDQPMSRDFYELVMAVSKSKSATIRYEGPQFRQDREISAAEKRAILNVIDAYRALGGTEY